MQSPDQDDTAFERIARHLAGEATVEERASLSGLLTTPGERARYEAAQTVWDASGAPAVDVDAAWNAVRARLDSAAVTPLTVGHIGPEQAHKWRLSGGLLRAAVVGFVLVTGSVIWSTVRAIRGAEPAAGTVASVAARTGIAERAVVKLPDGSEVQLGPASSLETRSGFGQGARDVELTGEAVFTVTHDASRPFRVHSGEAVIEDLGTRFVVRAVMDEPLRVAVSEGSVSIGRADSPRARHAVLNPRDVAVLGSTGDAVVTRGVDVERYSTWAGERAELVFDNVPLRAVFRELERWYDVRFDVTDASVLDRTFTAPVTGLSIDAVLQVMSTALALPFEREGKVVRLSPPVRTGLAVQEGAQVGGGA